MTRIYDNFLNLAMDTRIKSVRNGWYSFEETVFYGEKGGILPDEGTINGKKVLALKWEDGVLWHQVEGELSNPIHMEVDRLTRWCNTSVQSAFHLLDGFYERLGLHIAAIGVHLDHQWYEVDTKELPQNHLKEVQEFMDQQIMDNIKAEISYVKGSSYPDPRYQAHDEVRIVKFGDIDTQPCGTPHVNETRDILAFSVLGSERSGRGTKVFVACGPVVGMRLREYNNILRQMVGLSGVGIPDLPGKLDGLLTSAKALKKENEELRQALYRYRAQELLDKGDRFIWYQAKDAGELRAMSQAMLGKAERGMVLTAEIGGELCFAAVSPEGRAKEWLSLLKEHMQVTGGGSDKVVSGKISGGSGEVFQKTAENLPI